MTHPTRDISDEMYYTINLTYHSPDSTLATLKARTAVDPLGRSARTSRVVLDLSMEDLERAPERLRWLLITTAIDGAMGFMDVNLGSIVGPKSLRAT